MKKPPQKITAFQNVTWQSQNQKQDTKCCLPCVYDVTLLVASGYSRTVWQLPDLISPYRYCIPTHSSTLQSSYKAPPVIAAIFPLCAIYCHLSFCPKGLRLRATHWHAFQIRNYKA